MASTQSSLVLSFEAARKIIEDHSQGLHATGKELLDLLAAYGRVLAEPVAADRDFPPFDRATRDGYAVRSSDLSELPASLRIIGEIRAGVKPEELVEVQVGTAAAIMTGAPVPSGADAVLMLEHTERHGDSVLITKPITAGENVVPAGAEARRGQRLLSPNTKLDPASLALAAAAGRSRVLVYGKPRIAVLATGDELVDVDVPPGSNQIRNSNTYSLAAQVRAAGGDPVMLPIAPDEPKRLRQLIEEGFESQLLLISGGVSMGKYDLVEQVLAEFNTKFFFTGALIQPGRPIVFGRNPANKYFFGLPGNPVSTMVTFQLFVEPMIYALAGRGAQKLIFSRAQLGKEIKVKPGLKRFLPAMLSGEFENARVELVPWQGSGDMAATARANCFIVVAAEKERVAAGEWVPIMLR
ncbi:MAG: molybdopterin molybdenumtransferase MoeA [Acidobacteria bacterium]|jgi:molybdopterin molybdotransferase|nr:MAG: molybdopterin molybdenumtransferase MoeA [Acidobacteriota bacterium]